MLVAIIIALITIIATVLPSAADLYAYRDESGLRIVQMIGRPPMPAVILGVRMLISIGGGLLTAFRHIGVEAEGTETLNVALVALGVVAEFHCAAPLAVEPDRKALVIQAQNLSSGRTQKAQQDEDCHQGFGW
jgi:hypothetical protein